MYMQSVGKMLWVEICTYYLFPGLYARGMSYKMQHVPFCFLFLISESDVTRIGGTRSIFRGGYQQPLEIYGNIEALEWFVIFSAKKGRKLHGITHDAPDTMINVSCQNVFKWRYMCMTTYCNPLGEEIMKGDPNVLYV